MQALAWRTAVRSGRRAAAAAGLASSGPSATAATGTSGGVTNVWSAVFIPSAASTGASAARCSFHSSAHPLRAPASSDHYRTLGVSRTADKSEIKASYYKLAKQHHPDLTGSSNSEQFTRIQSAYEVLGDEKARKEYDARTSYSYSSPYGGGGATSSFWESASSSSSGRPSPENQSYSYAAWSTRGGAGGSRATEDPWADAGEWEYVVDDEGFTEEELFENLFGGVGGGGGGGMGGGGNGGGFAGHSGMGRRGASAKRRGAAANASTSAAAKKRAAAAEKQRARDREAEQMAAEEAAAFEAAAAARAARNRAKRKEEKRAAAVPGSDLTLEIPLTFVEAAQGTVKTIQFQADGSCRACGGGGAKPGSSSACRSCNGRGVQNMRMPGHQSMHVECDRCNGTGTYETQCGTCHGSGHVKEKRTVEVQVPAGVDGSSNIRLLNQGHSGRRGGAHGHLLLKAIIAPHPIFKRVGYDLHSEHTLPLTTALLGGVAQVPGLDGSIQSVRIEQGTQHLATRSLPGRGIKILDKLPKGGVSSAGTPGSYSMRGGHAYGSQQVTWRIELPKELSPKSKDLLKQLALEMGNIQNIDLTTDIRKQSLAAKKEASTAAAATAAAAAAVAAAEPAPAAAAPRASAAPANGDTFAAASSASATTAAAPTRAHTIPAGSAAAAAAYAASVAAAAPASDNSTVFTRARSGPAAARRAAGAARAAARVSAASADSSSAAAASTAASSSSASAASRDVEDEDFLSGTSSASAAAAPASASPAAAVAEENASAFEEEEEEEEVTPRLQDKRKYKRQLKKAIKSKEHRRTIHLDPISVSA